MMREIAGSGGGAGGFRTPCAAIPGQLVRITVGAGDICGRSKQPQETAMDDAEIRLECLRIALSFEMDIDPTLDLAKKLYQFIVAGDLKS